MQDEMRVLCSETMVTRLQKKTIKIYFMTDTGQVASQNLLFYRTKSEVACEREKEIEKEA